MYGTIAIVGIGVSVLFGVVTIAWVVSLLAGRARNDGTTPAVVPSAARRPGHHGDGERFVEPATAPGPLLGFWMGLWMSLGHGRIGTYLLPLAAFLSFQFGVFLAATATDVSIGEASLGWPTAPGAIGASQIITEPGDQGPEHRVHILYAFAIGAQPYTGDKVRFGGVESHEARETVARYPKGKDVAVRYAPDDPSLSVLEPGADPFVRRFMWWCLVVVALLAPLASLTLVARMTAWRGRRRYGAYPTGATGPAAGATPAGGGTS